MSSLRGPQDASDDHSATSKDDLSDANFSSSSDSTQVKELKSNSLSQKDKKNLVTAASSSTAPLPVTNDSGPLLDSVVSPSGMSTAFKRVMSSDVGRYPSKLLHKQARLADSSMDNIFANMGPPEQRTRFCKICKEDYKEPFLEHIQSIRHQASVQRNNQ